MALSEALAIDRLTPGDIAAGCALSEAASWNQTADDWGFFIAQRSAIGCRDSAGRLIASAAALPYEGGVGWISMVLVAADFRHRGLATSLLERSIDSLRARGLTPVLDATPAGEAVYRQLGFVAGTLFDRWEATLPADAADGIDRIGCRPVEGDDVASLLAIDAAASGLGRSALLQSLLARPGTCAWLAAGGAGFVLARAGSRATQVGPLVASSADSAAPLLAAALAACRGRVFIDVPRHAVSLVERLQARGFTRQRPFVRMALGASALPQSDPRVHAFAGPEFG